MEGIAQHIQQVNQGILPQLDENQLDKLIQEFPCFQTAHILKALQLKQESTQESFDASLPKIAIHVQNRAKLYDVIHATYQVQQEQVKEIPQDDEELNAILAKAETQIKETPKKTPELETKAISLNTEEVNDLQSLINEVKTKKEKQPIVSKVEKIAKPKTTPKAKKKKQAVKKTVAVLTEPTSFVAWLKATKHSSETEVVQAKPIKKTVKAPKEERIPIDATASHEALLHQETKKSSFKLEDFLIGQIEKKQDKKTRNANENSFGISETYAKILVQQGNIEKAIQVYKELSIKYPKKSTNFASQIEKLKNNL